jgi:hypothetical protein
MSITNLKFKDEDDFDGGSSVESFNINVVDNGFILNVESDDGEIKEVYTNIDKVFKRIQELL